MGQFHPEEKYEQNFLWSSYIGSFYLKVYVTLIFTSFLTVFEVFDKIAVLSKSLLMFL